MKHRSIFIGTLTFFLLFTACDSETESITNTEDTEMTESTGTLSFSVTDAPIDNANIESCVVTIAELRVDNQKVEGYSKTTVDLLAYQDGNTMLLGEYDIEASSYNSIELVLDHEFQDNSNMPGCYIEENDGTIHTLAEEEINISLNSNFDVEADAVTEVLLDFDLRKCVASNDTGSSQFRLVNETDLQSAVRVTSKNNRSIKGNCDSFLTGSDKVIVYAYAKGSYNRNQEMKGQGQHNLTFKQAINSAECDESGDFEMHFMNEGEYELHFMGYDEEADGSLSLKGHLEVNSLSLLSPLSLIMSTETDLEINVIATALIGI